MSDAVEQDQFGHEAVSDMGVSIIIPAYDAAETLAEALQSLLAQTHQRWEAIVVDDGSTDRTAEVAARFKARDSRIRFVQQSNGGPGSARNRGIAEARHAWLLFLDADDWIAPVHLARLTAELQSNPELDAILCGYARVAADGTCVPDKYEPPGGDMFPVLARRAAFAVHACLVRKALVEEVGGFDNSLQKSEDWDLWQRIARMGARFGAIREVLAYYRMQPGSESLDPRPLLRDGLRVLRQGHSADPRVRKPLPEHVQGMPHEQTIDQQYYLLTWCAGLMIGREDDPRPLLDSIEGHGAVDLNPGAIAQCVFESAPLSSCRSSRAWDTLWPRTASLIDEFFTALGTHAKSPDLAAQSGLQFKTMLLADSPAWGAVIKEYQGTVDRLKRTVQHLERDKRISEEASHNWRRLAVERHNEATQLRRQVELLVTERDALQYSPERAAGDFLLNRMHLKRPALAMAGGARTAGLRLETARLAAERAMVHRNQLRVLATVCSSFPIYSQTFVHQELNQLVRTGVALRLIYSKLNSQRDLSKQFMELWPLKRRLPLNRNVHQRDFAHYRSRMPDKVEQLIERLCHASGLNAQALLGHDNFLQAFSFTRMAEAFRPHYLHSYFFYDRSFMTLVAGWMLGIPRGISCYADHMLQDYDLKVVPLHLELCDIVVATSQRIKHELLELAPQIDPARVLVKPNGIDTEFFLTAQRAEPAQNAPFRIISVCRIDPKKGLLDLVEAVHLLRQQGLDVEAHIIGAADEWSHDSRNYKRQLDVRISELSLWGKVHLEGQQDHDGVRRFLGLSHLFVAPFVETQVGDKDGIPTAMLEGMATGLSVVATNAGSIPEVVEDGQNGLLVPQRDPAALAGAIESLLRDPDRRRRLGQNAAQTVRAGFDVRTCEEPFHQRLREVIEKRNPVSDEQMQTDCVALAR
jgi:glycosyltransferase involved in cell wall biosynthesis/GT2 family glycosyltransferase